MPSGDSLMEWFRFYTRTLDSAKVQGLPDRLFKLWVNLCCLARERDGPLPKIHDMAFRLRTREDHLVRMLAELENRNLVEKRVNGDLWMHDWEQHQRVSDNVAMRVAKHRAKQAGNVTVTPPDTDTDTEQIQSRTDAEKNPLAARPAIQHEYPLTLAEIQKHDAGVDVFFCVKLADEVARSVISDPVASKWPPGKADRAVSDPILARACKESYLTPGRNGKHGTGLLLKTVPRIVINGKINYA